MWLRVFANAKNYMVGEEIDWVSKTLGFYPIVIAVVTITAIVSVCIINMYLLVRHKKNHVTIFIHLISLFVILGLIFHMINIAIVVLSLSQLYHHMALISFFLAGFSLVAGVIISVSTGKKNSLRSLTNNITEALKSIENVVFVIDFDGTITHINHPNQYHTLFNNINTMDQLYTFMKEYFNKEDKRIDFMKDIETTQTFELYFEQLRKHILLQIAPLSISGGRIGYTAIIEDVSKIREIENKLREQNENLQEANEKLSNYIKVAGELDAEKERLQILTQIQKTLIQDIEKALIDLQYTKKQCFEDETYPIALKELAVKLRQMYQKVRSAVGQIAGREEKL